MKRRGPPRTTRTRTRRGRAEGERAAWPWATQEPGARARRRPRTTSPREASASLWRPGARKMGRRRGPRPGFALKRAQTGDEALRPEAARPTQTGQGREAAHRRTRPAGGRAAHGRHETNAFCALQREAWPWAMTAPHRPRGACGHGGGLHQQTANTDRQRDGRGGRVRERDLCTRRPE